MLDIDNVDAKAIKRQQRWYEMEDEKGNEVQEAKELKEKLRLQEEEFAKLKEERDQLLRSTQLLEKANQEVLQRFLCPVCLENKRYLLKWPKCEHVVCLECVQNQLEMPYTKINRESKNELDGKLVFHFPSFALDDYEYDPSVRDCNILFGFYGLIFDKHPAQYRQKCPICRGNEITLLHNDDVNGGMMFKMATNSDLVPESLDDVKNCPHCKKMFDPTDPVNSRIHHLLYSCPSKSLPCPWSQDDTCRVKWHPLSKMDIKKYTNTQGKNNYYNETGIIADELDEQLFSYCAALLKEHFSKKECKVKFTCFGCAKERNPAEHHSHVLHDCQMHNLWRGLDALWADTTLNHRLNLNFVAPAPLQQEYMQSRKRIIELLTTCQSIALAFKLKLENN